MEDIKTLQDKYLKVISKIEKIVDSFRNKDYTEEQLDDILFTFMNEIPIIIFGKEELKVIVTSIEEENTSFDKIANHYNSYNKALYDSDPKIKNIEKDKNIKSDELKEERLSIQELLVKYFGIVTESERIAQSFADKGYSTDQTDDILITLVQEVPKISFKDFELKKIISTIDEEMDFNELDNMLKTDDDSLINHNNFYK